MKDLAIEERVRRVICLEQRIFKVRKKIAWRKAKRTTFKCCYLATISSIIGSSIAGKIGEYSTSFIIINILCTVIIVELLLLWAEYKLELKKL